MFTLFVFQAKAIQEIVKQTKIDQQNMLNNTTF